MFGKPVFVLADDRDLRDQVKLDSKGTVGGITSSSLIYGVVGAADLAPEFVGLAHFNGDSKKTWELAKHLEEERKRLIDEVKPRKPNKELVMNDQEYRDYITSRPFTQTLIQLAEDLKKARAAEAPAKGDGNDSPKKMSRADMFDQKYKIVRKPGSTPFRQ